MGAAGVDVKVPICPRCNYTGKYRGCNSCQLTHNKAKDFMQKTPSSEYLKWCPVCSTKKENPNCEICKGKSTCKIPVPHGWVEHPDKGSGTYWVDQLNNIYWELPMPTHRRMAIRE